MVAVEIISCNGKKTLPKLDDEIGLNISDGGLLMECSKKLDKGTRLRLKIMLIYTSSYKIIELPAKIVWCKRSFCKTYYLGCKFTRITPVIKKAIKKFTLPYLVKF